MDYKEKIVAATNAHAQWLFRLRSAVDKGTSEFKSAVVKTDNACDFGKWLYGPEFPPQAKNTALYAEIKDLHARFHQEAARILELALAGKKAEATQAMGPGTELIKLSGSMVLKLGELKKVL